MPKFTNAERELVKNIIALFSIKKVSDSEIITEIKRQTNKSVTQKSLYYLRKDIKRDSYEWYKSMREGQYEYIHEFKERIDEVLWLQRKHHEIIDSDKEPTTVKQSSLAELHRLNITLSSYFDVAPDIINGSTLSPPSEAKTTTAAPEIIV
jgi:hypothetical protein